MVDITWLTQYLNSGISGFMLNSLENRLFLSIIECGGLREYRDMSKENISYSEGITELCKILQEAMGSKDPQQNLTAEKYCILFQRNYCTSNDNERIKLNDQLMKLTDAQASVSLVLDSEKYRQVFQGSYAEVKEDRLPYHGCSVFVKTQIDILNRSGQGTGIEAEKHLWTLRKENLRVCRDAFKALQKKALLEQPDNEQSVVNSPEKQPPDFGPSEIQVGKRVSFHAAGTDVKLTGIIKEMNDRTVVMQCGTKIVPVLRNKGIFKPAPELLKENMKHDTKKQETAKQKDLGR